MKQSLELRFVETLKDVLMGDTEGGLWAIDEFSQVVFSGNDSDYPPIFSPVAYL
jgi:hypothetical protein